MSLQAHKRQLAGIAVLVVILIILISLQLGGMGPGKLNMEEEIAQHLDGSRPYVKPDPLPWNPPTPESPDSDSKDVSSLHQSSLGAMVIVKHEYEDVSFLEAEFQDWDRSIQTIGHDFAKIHLYGGRKADNGRIANAYLTYIVGHYNILPSIIVFLNTDALIMDRNDEGAYASPNHIDYIESFRYDIQSSGYVNLRCFSGDGCRREYTPNRKPVDEFRTLEVAMPTAWKELFNNTAVPDKISAPSSSTFGVTRDQVRKRPVEEYLRYWEWLNKTTMDDDTAGLVFEYLWHIIFGQEAQYCIGLVLCAW